jgi:carbamoyltransferase
MYFAWSILMRIMGISPFHDSSVAIINDGKLESFYKEERLTRKKRDIMPWNSFREAIKDGNKIDFITIASPYGIDVWLPPIKIMLEKMLSCPVILYCDRHHLSHASLAFYNSGFEKSLVFVVDRNGSVYHSMREAETVFEASYPCEFKTLHKNFWVYNTGTDTDSRILAQLQELNSSEFTYNADSTMSIVKVYESATTLIGQDVLENGKTMGLAAYGVDKPFDNFFLNGRPIDNLFIHKDFRHSEQSPVSYRKYLGKETNEVTSENYQLYADFAFQVQKQTQEQLLKMVSEWVEKSGINKVCITGGYGLNVVANEYLIKNLPNVEFFFEPLADDTGNSIGSAMHLYRNITRDSCVNKLETTFTHGKQTPLEQVGIECDEHFIVQKLMEQKTVAVFNGLAESGPRALGNRSILFDARNLNAKSIVNNIKKREWYRPFAGMILQDYFSDWFDTHGLLKSEYMTVSFQCKKPYKIPGVVHADGSCRIQTVNDTNYHIYSLLNTFYKNTGCPVLLNTSFNLAGEPLIETQEQAIETFNNSDIDVLWFPEISSCLLKV